MTTIGFDVSKNELVGVRTDRSAEPKETFIIPNTKEDICNFFDHLSRRKVVVAAEATGEYHRALALECLRRHIPMRLLNPITTKRFTRATVRKTKTDLTDALIIAKLALQGEGSTLTEESFNPLKTVTRTSNKLVQMIMMLELMQQRLKLALPEEKRSCKPWKIQNKRCRRRSRASGKTSKPPQIPRSRSCSARFRGSVSRSQAS